MDHSPNVTTQMALSTVHAKETIYHHQEGFGFSQIVGLSAKVNSASMVLLYQCHVSCPKPNKVCFTSQRTQIRTAIRTQDV